MVLSFILFSFTIILVGRTNSLLLEPRERCTPTATARGDCHSCVCSTAGEYHCRAHTCLKLPDNGDVDTSKECEPNRMYRADKLLCTCSFEGLWMSQICRSTFRQIPPKAYRPIQKLRTNIPCKPKSLYLLDCNVCECSKSGFIEMSSCTSRRCKVGRKADECATGDILRTKNEVCSCSDINLYVDRLCVKVTEEPIQEIDRRDLDNILDISGSQLRTDDVCIPHTIVRVDCNRCICTSNGNLACTNKICVPKKVSLRNKKRDPFLDLPKLPSKKRRCKPNKLYRHKCNTCVCSLKGVPSCTTMICLEDVVLDKKIMEAAIMEQRDREKNEMNQ